VKIFDPSSHQAKKRFGQNFLHDSGIIDRIVKSMSIKQDDNILEIGPGLGAITTQILAITKSINVIELDRDIIPKLKFNCDGLGDLHILQTDALKVDYNQFSQDALQQDRLLRVVGNLPYNISTPLLFHLFTYLEKIKDMHFMLQKEVVLRMAANPGSKAYGRLSVMTQSVCDVQMLFLVPPESFIPVPKVESAIVRLKPREKALQIQDRELLALIVMEAFNQRRKTLRNVWKNRIDAKTLESLDINPTLRPEMISLHEFVLVSNYLSDSR